VQHRQLATANVLLPYGAPATIAEMHNKLLLVHMIFSLDDLWGSHRGPVLSASHQAPKFPFACYPQLWHRLPSLFRHTSVESAYLWLRPLLAHDTSTHILLSWG
jgi:hypothetical protein